jgi:hypothetical protein
MKRPEIRATFEDLESLVRELDTNLRHGGTFVRGAAGLNERDEVELVVVHPIGNAEIRFVASVVWVVREGDDAGVGVAVRDFGVTQREQINKFIHGAPTPSEAPKASSANPYEKLRGLSGPEQQKIAQGGNVNERIQIERIYGKMVWEAILRNPRVTVPEVARIAKMGALPKHLFEIIGANTAFLRVPQVRRALLGNPKTPPALAEKVLRLAPRAELKLIPGQPSYPHSVRAKARQLLLR